MFILKPEKQVSYRVLFVRLCVYLCMLVSRPTNWQSTPRSRLQSMKKKRQKRKRKIKDNITSYFNTLMVFINMYAIDGNSTMIINLSLYFNSIQKYLFYIFYQIVAISIIFRIIILWFLASKCISQVKNIIVILCCFFVSSTYDGYIMRETHIFSVSNF